ncbi:DNA cytosine methyltransferase [Anaerocolumna jejuensis]|uniref:DNA cytosine methyltransferase n=1 Tax=Anaerocolumna jejuensis TaxID=259063 RepID=UPI003F7B91A9
MRELIIDCFAGGGGASVGIEMALGRTVDYAINHDPFAIKMHEKNHTDTYHYTEDIMKVQLKNRLKRDDKVRFMWASPDCTQHSRAKGGKPVEKGLRILPYGVRRLCVQIQDITGHLPEVIIMENVAEIQEWGPLDENNKPIKERKGEDYKKFINSMITLGYEFDCRELVAADYGVPTTRKRWFAIFRCDGRPIVWPEPTHNKDGSNGLKKWVPVSSVLNFNDLGKSIFGRKKPLADKTMKRIAGGMDKFVFNDLNPFMVTVNHGGDNFRGQSIDSPISTITQKNGVGVVTPYITQIGYGERKGQSARVNSLDNPLNTVVSSGNKHYLRSPFVIQYHSETSSQPRGQSVKEPIQTIDTSNRYALLSAFLTKFYKTGTGQSLFSPLHTVTTSPGHFGQVTIKAIEWERLKEAGISDEVAQKCTWVSQFIMEYYGCGTGQSLNDPLHTIVTKDRFALITVMGNEYCIVDIYLRMLSPEELKLAQGFPIDYIIDSYSDGTPVTISEQVKRIGNSVCPGLARVLTEANVPYLKVGERMPNMRIDDSQPQLRFA